MDFLCDRNAKTILKNKYVILSIAMASVVKMINTMCLHGGGAQVSDHVIFLDESASDELGRKKY